MDVTARFAIEIHGWGGAMQILLIVPDGDVREALRVRLGDGNILRAGDYNWGIVLAEQNCPTEIVLWSPKGAHGDAVETLRRLQRLHRSARYIVMTPEITKGGMAVFCDHFEVDAYIPDDDVELVAHTLLGVPQIVERDHPAPKFRASGSSFPRH
jgi:hypothetical protein